MDDVSLPSCIGSDSLDSLPPLEEPDDVSMPSEVSESPVEYEEDELSDVESSSDRGLPSRIRRQNDFRYVFICLHHIEWISIMTSSPMRKVSIRLTLGSGTT